MSKNFLSVVNTIRIVWISFISAALFGCFNESDFELTNERVGDILSLNTESGDSSIPADGYSGLVVVATVAGTSISPTIDFTTTEGSFVGASSENKQLVQVVVNSEGVARATLISNRSVTDLVVRATVNGNTQINRELELEFSEPVIADIIRFTNASMEAPADGATLTPISVSIDPNLPTPLGTVTFRTNRGVFAVSDSTSDAVTADADNVATVDLKSPSTVGPTRITAEVNGFSVETGFEFQRALPETLQVTSEDLTVRADNVDSSVITLRLMREVGIPTGGQSAVITATTESGSVLDAIRNQTESNAEGVITATFFPGDTTVRGDILINASVPGSTAIGDTTITIIDEASMAASYRQSDNQEAIVRTVFSRLAAVSNFRNFSGVVLIGSDETVWDIRPFGLADSMAGIPNSKHTRFMSDLFLRAINDRDKKSELRGLLDTELFEPGQLSGTTPGGYAFGLPLLEERQRLFITVADLFRAWRERRIECGQPMATKHQFTYLSAESGARVCLSAQGDWATVLLSLQEPAVRIVILSNKNTLTLEDLLGL